MFENKKSKSYFYFLIGIGIFIATIFLANIFLIPKDKYKTLKPGESFILGSESLKIKSIEKSIDFLYLELIDYNYIENINKFKFKTKTEKNVDYSIEPEILYNYKGYYLIKIPLKKYFKTLKFMVEYENDIGKSKVSNHTYFNEFEIKVNENFKEKTKKEYILDYISFLIEENNEKIKGKNEEFTKNNEIILTKNNELKLLTDELQYKTDEEKVKSENKIFSNKRDIFSLKNKIIEIENEIIDLKNTNLVLKCEHIFIETGKKEKPKLLNKKKKLTELDYKNKISENNNPSNILEEVSKPKEKEVKKEENVEKNNTNPVKNNQQNNVKPKQNTTNNALKNQNNTKKSTPKNNNSYIKPKENSKKNGEIEIEFTP